MKEKLTIYLCINFQKLPCKSASDGVVEGLYNVNKSKNDTGIKNNRFEIW